jgi:hypothetical protein
MEDHKNVERIITLFNLNYKENDIILLINMSDEQINKLYKLASRFKTNIAIEIICSPDEEIPYLSDVLFKYKITNIDLDIIFANKVDNMFKRMAYICEKIREAKDHRCFTRAYIRMAYQMVKDNNDTDEIITKTVGFIKNGTKSITAYYESIKPSKPIKVKPIKS